MKTDYPNGAEHQQVINCIRALMTRLTGLEKHRLKNELWQIIIELDGWRR